MTEEKNESIAEDTVDSMIDAAQSTTRFTMNAIGNTTESPGRLETGTRILARRKNNGKKNEENQ